MNSKYLIVAAVLLLLGGCCHPKTGNRYNVRAFGAKGDGKTDDTEAIQKAINAAASSVHGGIVFFPAGVYNIAGPVIDSVGGLGCHSQLYIPYSDMEHTKTIVFQGEVPTEFECQGLINITPPMSGTILSSSIITTDSAHAVIGMVKGPGKDDWKQWNYITPSFKDLCVRTRTMKDDGPVTNSLCGINLRYASKCYLDNIFIDTSCPLKISKDPGRTGSAGLITPEWNNHALIHVGLVRVVGYAYGIKFSEHFVGTDIQVCCCNVGVVVERGHHSSSIQTLEIECCRYSVVFDTGHNLFVANYNTEHYNGDEWYRFERDVTFLGAHYYAPKMVIGLCHPVVSNVGYDFDDFTTNDPDRVVLLEVL
jgi:hypothetical protein